MTPILVMWKYTLCILCTLWPLELWWDNQQSSSDSLNSNWSALRLQRISVAFYTSSDRPTVSSHSVPLLPSGLQNKYSIPSKLIFEITPANFSKLIITFTDDLCNNITTVFNNPNQRKSSYLFFFSNTEVSAIAFALMQNKIKSEPC